MMSVCRFTTVDNAIMGSLFGELFAFRFPSLFLDTNKVARFDHNLLHKREMSVTKGFDALTSMIKSINIAEDKRVFVTGVND